MVQARTHRDQGSLSGLVYSFFPAPASCQAPLPTVGLSSCTVSNLPALLPASPPASWLPYPCTSGNLPALLETSWNISQTLFALSLLASLPAFLHFLQPPELPAPQPWSPLPNFHGLRILPHSFFPSLLVHLPFPHHTLPLPLPASSSPLSVLSSTLLHRLFCKNSST